MAGPVGRNNGSSPSSQQQKLPAGYVEQLSNPYAKGGGFRAARTQLMRVRDIDALFVPAANLSAAVYVTLLGLVYFVLPRLTRTTPAAVATDDVGEQWVAPSVSEDWEYLHVDEQSAAMLGFVTLILCTVLILLPVAFHRKVVKGQKAATEMAGSFGMAGIVHAALVVQMCSIATNFILAFCPNVVKIDPVTGSRVFLTRWCEFIPLAGLMTFLCEAVDLPITEHGLRTTIIFCVFQSFSCLCGAILPMCGNFGTWSAALGLAFLFYFPIFWRLWKKYDRARLLPPAGTTSSFVEEETNERIRMSYKLILTCTIAWTVFVGFFMTNLYIRVFLPEDHFLRIESLSLILDTLFDVIAKAFYMLIIVEIHHKLEKHHW